MFFLLMASSQFIPALSIGPIYTYWGPLCFVTFVALCREAFDDFRRFQRDREVNSTRYSKLAPTGKVSVASSDLKVNYFLIIYL
jgi:phospholipid-translocating ATPase